MSRNLKAIKSSSQRFDELKASKSLEENHHSYEDELENIFSSRIDDEYIMSVTGVRDLSRVEYISLQIDTTIQSILDLPDLLPNLKHLVLDNSTLPSIRDLGVGLRHLSSLSLSGCGLQDLDGIGVLTGLQELCLSDNYISDVTPLYMHEYIQNLNLSGNRITDLDFGMTLASCPMLRSLFLSRNPVDKIKHYRAIVGYHIPNIEMLDGVPMDSHAANKINSSVLIEATNELKLLEEELNEQERFEFDLSSAHSSVQKSTNKMSVNSLARISASTSNSLNGELIPDTGSELTHGSSVVLAGNVAAAMRKRRTGNENGIAIDKHTANEEKEFESALDVLDSAIHGTISFHNERETNKSKPPVNYHKEGDITESIMGFSSPSKPKSRSKLNLSVENLEIDPDLSSISKRPLSSQKNNGKDNSKEKSIPLSPSTPDRLKLNMEKFTSSPRQINGSRPPSAAGLTNSAFQGNSSLPFNVACNTSRKFSASSNDGDDDEDVDFHVLENNIPKRIAGKKGNETSPDFKDKNKNSSIVHLDIVKRNKISKDKKPTSFHLPSSFDLKDIEDENSDNEDIAVTHHERLKMMSMSAGNTASTISKTRQSVLMKLQQTTINESTEEEEEIDRKIFKKIDFQKKQNETINPHTISNSSKAGVSLGFNLAGSLAAIDKWAQDMSSEEDASDDELHHGIAEQPIQFGNFVSPRPSTGKILSRNEIFNLCAGNTNPKSSEVTPRHDDSIPNSERSQNSKDGFEEIPNHRRSDFNPTNLNKSEAPSKTPKKILGSRSEASFDPIKSAAKAIITVDKSSRAESPIKPTVNNSRAISLTDKELIDLLRKPPKAVTVLRTKSSFQEFFKGIDAKRYKTLLELAYSDIIDRDERESKIKRRWDLMEGAFD